MIVWVCIFSINSFSEMRGNCPSLDFLSARTLNKKGNSSYSNSVLFEIFNILIKSYHLNLRSPILDIGSGYGEAPFELIKMGANNIYVNELDSLNMECIKKSISLAYSNNGNKLHYLAGDITAQLIESQLPNHYFGFINAKNVIHLLSYHQLISFIKILNKKSSRNGLVMIVFENPYKNELRFLINSIYGAREKFQKYDINEIVEGLYDRFTFKGKRHCSSEAYQKAPAGMKLPGFPCELPVSSGVGQLLLPEIIIDLMTAGGFDTILTKSQSDHAHTQTLIFRKRENLSSKEIDRNIKRIFFKEKFVRG